MSENSGSSELNNPLYDSDKHQSSSAMQWNSHTLFNFIFSRTQVVPEGFVVDDMNREAVKALCYYFTEDPAFERMNTDGQSWKLSKGLLLFGNVGTGKTTLMRAFNKNPRCCYQVANCRRLSALFAEQGHDMLYRYSSPVPLPTAADTFYQRQAGICFDDLGTEELKKNYGNQVNVMAEIILNRYDNQQTPWHHTHITTNLTAAEIEQYYGTRVKSRMREMFNMITLDGEDRRR
ncbi:cell division protein ZapE [Chitinophaga varians]|uniref:Cell division protein ZapE n=1 Tax=Chitinophaga varians TaxID=2202339 RepID=A0A847S5P4_9BACT|nr:cell division protein ZapE [Chitinophaga varians]NLR66911.1 cell division protein ZapE [Chitinophaga varians]